MSLKNNKKGVKLQHYLIGLFIITAIVLGTTGFIAELQLNTGTQVNASYNATYDKLNQTLQIANQTSSQLEDESISSTALQAGLLSGYPILKIIFNSYGTMIALIHDVAVDLSLPPWIPVLILGIVSITLIFALINALFNREN